MGATFTTGLYSLLLGLAFSGWSRSRQTRLTTRIAGGIGVVLITLTVLQLG